VGALGHLDITLAHVDDAMGDVHSIELETQRTEAEMAGLLNQTRHGMLTKNQETELVANANLLLTNSNAAVIQLTDSARQIGTVPATVNQAIGQIMSDTHAAIASAQPGIENLNRAAGAAATAMSDPAIHDTLTHVDGVAGNADATMSDIHGFVHRETTPVRGTWNVIKAFLMEFAGPASQVATAAK
jgi:hypothetical protein